MLSFETMISCACAGGARLPTSRSRAIAAGAAVRQDRAVRMMGPSRSPHHYKMGAIRTYRLQQPKRALPGCSRPGLSVEWDSRPADRRPGKPTVLCQGAREERAHRPAGAEVVHQLLGQVGFEDELRLEARGVEEHLVEQQ